MKRKALPFQSGLNRKQLEHYAEGWLQTCRISLQTDATIQNRRAAVDKLYWFLDREKIEIVDTIALRQVFEHIARGHLTPSGRWGSQFDAPRPSTVATYHRIYKTMMTWITKEANLAANPMDRLEAPIHREDQVKPYSVADVEKLLAAARTTTNAQRDLAIVALLLDTGLRASELCGLTRGDVDIRQHQIRVMGKGQKVRYLSYGNDASRALWAYLTVEQEPDAPLFESSSGRHLTRSGLQQLIYRIASVAGVSGANVHRFRHTFAILASVGGMNQYELMHRMGHTGTKMTTRYVNYASAHGNTRRPSVLDALKRK